MRCERGRVGFACRRLLDSKYRAAAVCGRALPFFLDELLQRRARGLAFEFSGLGVEPLQCCELLFPSELRVPNGGFQYPNGFVVDLKRYRIRMSILPAVSQREARRIAEAIWRSVYDFGNHCQC